MHKTVPSDRQRQPQLFGQPHAHHAVRHAMPLGIPLRNVQRDRSAEMISESRISVATISRVAVGGFSIMRSTVVPAQAYMDMMQSRRAVFQESENGGQSPTKCRSRATGYPMMGVFSRERPIQRITAEKRVAETSSLGVPAIGASREEKSPLLQRLLRGNDRWDFRARRPGERGPITLRTKQSTLYAVGGMSMRREDASHQIECDADSRRVPLIGTHAMVHEGRKHQHHAVDRRQDDRTHDVERVERVQL